MLEHVVLDWVKFRCINEPLERLDATRARAHTHRAPTEKNPHKHLSLRFRSFPRQLLLPLFYFFTFFLLPYIMKSSNNSPTMVPPKKRRKASSPTGSTVSSPVSQAQTPSTEENDQGKRKTTRSKDEETPIAAPAMALPPPLMPYPHPPHAHFVVQSPYYPLYPPTPFYVPVGSSPPLPPHRGSVGGSNSGSSNSNNNSANGANSKQSSGTPRILPKAPTGTECFPSPEYHPLYPHPHPYALPISPPTLRGKQPEALSTADQREQARKLSHSAIERRRRERINDKIVQLRQLIPSCADQEHLHKMTVLQSAIDYITYLKQVVSKLEGEDRVHVSLKMQKTPKSMLPKEVEPFTTQFSVQQGKPRRRSESSNSSSNSADQNDSAAASAAESKSE